MVRNCITMHRSSAQNHGPHLEVQKLGTNLCRVGQFVSPMDAVGFRATTEPRLVQSEDELPLLVCFMIAFDEGGKARKNKKKRVIKRETANNAKKMASNAPEQRLKPLAFMEVLSPIVSLYRPATTPTSSNSSPAAPKLIILASWTGAQDLHIAKYLIKYQAIYSASQILLIKSPSSLLFRPTLIPAAVAPAVDAIKTLFPVRGQDGNNNRNSTPEIIIHLFSNGGSSSISGLYDTYAASSPNRPTLPPHVTIIDSAPSTITFSSSVAFFSVGLPPVQHLLSMPFICLFASF